MNRHSDLVIHLCTYRHLENYFQNWQTYMPSPAGHNGKHRSSWEDSVIRDRYLLLELGRFTLKCYLSFKFHTNDIQKIKFNINTPHLCTLSCTYSSATFTYTHWYCDFLLASLAKDHLSTRWSTMAYYIPKFVDRDAVEKQENNVSVTQTVSSYLPSKNTHIPKELCVHKRSISCHIYLKQN